MTTKCEATSYSGRSQYDRLVGKPCARRATFTLVKGDLRKGFCKQHAMAFLRQVGPYAGWETR